MNENNNSYFTDETGPAYSDPANRSKEPPMCEICGQEEIFVRCYDDNKMYGLECAFLAGEPTAMMIKAQRSVDELLNRPIQDEKEAA